MKNILLFILSVLVFVSCASNKNKDNSDSSDKSSKVVNVTELMKLEPGQKFFAVIKTNMGTIELQLFDKEAPKTVKNFVVLADQHFFDGVIFHRVIKKFMIQTGDPTGTGRGGASIYGHPFENELSANLKFDKPGVVGMANAGPNTNQSQFFITVAPYPSLNLNYTIFGKVVKGMDVVNAISEVPTNNMDKPYNDVVMEKVTIEKRKPAI